MEKKLFIVELIDGSYLSVWAYSDMNAINEAVTEFNVETTDIVHAQEA